MKNFNPDTKKEPLSPAQFAAKPVLALFARHHLPIWRAARLLGGHEASRLVDKCAGALERDAAITNQVRIMLDQILDILSLEHVGDPDMPYLDYFMLIDPADPVVEEICLLTDQVREAITEAAARRAWAESREKMPQGV